MKLNGTVEEILENNFNKEVLEYKGKVLVDFYADWCGPCQVQSPIVEEVSGELKDVKFVKVNVDNNRILSNDYEIIYIPTLILFENGKEIRRTNFIYKDKLVEFINNGSGGHWLSLLLYWHKYIFMI